MLLRSPVKLALVTVMLCALPAVVGCSAKPTSPGGEDPIVGEQPCPAGQKRCGDTCVATSPENGCGAQACTACAVPEGGSAICTSDFPAEPTHCAASCPKGQKACDGRCVAEAPENGCGSAACSPCALANVSAQTCTLGQCDYEACNYFSEDLDGNRSNGCEAASCGPFSKRCPDGSCHDPMDPAVGCSNDSCTPCDATNGVASCEETAPFSFTYQCALTYANLNKKCDGACVPATTPATGCAGDSCTPCTLQNVVGPYCSLFTASCAYDSCAEGWMELDGNAENGCEAIAGCFVGQKTCGSTQRCLSDPSAGCGGTSCSPCPYPSSLHGVPTCNAGPSGYTCGFACNDGYKLCGSDCVAERIDVGCGEAGCEPCSARLKNVMVSSIVCSSTGGCDYGQCQPGYEDLDGNRSNGCESVSPRAVRSGALQLWYRGDVGLVPSSNGSFVWDDQASWNRDAAGQSGSYCTQDEGETTCISTSAPTIGSNFNGSGRAYASFAASGGYASVVGGLDWVVCESSYTIFVVLGRSYASNDQYALGTGGGCSGCRNQALNIGYRNATTFTFDQGNNGLNVPIAAMSGSGLQVHRAVARFDEGAGHMLRVTDGSGAVQTAQNANLEPLLRAGDNIFRVGHGSSDFGTLPGGIAELIIYNAPLSDTEIATVEAYLKRKWGF